MGNPDVRHIVAPIEDILDGSDSIPSSTEHPVTVHAGYFPAKEGNKNWCYGTVLDIEPEETVKAGENGPLGDKSVVETRASSDLPLVKNSGLSDSPFGVKVALLDSPLLRNEDLSDSPLVENRGLSGSALVENAGLSKPPLMETGGLSDSSLLENVIFSNLNSLKDPYFTSPVVRNEFSLRNQVLSDLNLDNNLEVAHHRAQSAAKLDKGAVLDLGSNKTDPTECSNCVREAVEAENGAGSNSDSHNLWEVAETRAEDNSKELDKVSRLPKIVSHTSNVNQGDPDMPNSDEQKSLEDANPSICHLSDRVSKNSKGPEAVLADNGNNRTQPHMKGRKTPKELAKHNQRPIQLPELALEDREVCTLCNRYFGDEDSLLRHVNRVHKESYVGATTSKGCKGAGRVSCIHCGDTLKSKVNLARHVLMCHTGEQPYRCMVCDASFCTKRARTRHFNRLHVDLQGTTVKGVEIPRKRGRCGEANGKMYGCDMCDYSSFLKSNVSRHRLLKHFRKKGFQCTFRECSLSFGTRHNLMVHTLTHR